MSVLIKGMTMPTSEEKCKFFQPAPFRAPFCVINGVCHGIDDCPLIPIPPHGDLIERNALFKKCEFVCTDDDEDIRAVRYSIIENAPTIIPAEEES